MNSHGYSTLAIALSFAGKPIEGEMAMRKALDLNPEEPYAQEALGFLKLEMRDPNSALIAFMNEPDNEARMIGLAIAYHALGRGSEAESAVAEFEKEYGKDHPYEMAVIRAYRGEVDSAFQWLDRAYQLRDSELSSIKGDWRFKKLWPDARFKAFLQKKMKLPV
jgi:tetratricopeptide (TPR) repeat protein